MLTIKCSCSYIIITRAVHLRDKPQAALLLPGADDCESCLDQDQLRASLDANPGAIIVYNQHADALALVGNLQVVSDQIHIRIRQDTKGVLGLQALRERAHQPETLELIYQ